MWLGYLRAKRQPPLAEQRMLQGKSVAAQPQWPPGEGFGGAEPPLLLLSDPLPEPVPLPEPLFFPPRATPEYFGGAFLVGVSSVPVGGGFATGALAVGCVSTVGAGLVGGGTNATGAGAGGSGRKAMASATIIAATAMPPPMKRPVLFFGGGARSAAVSGLGDAPPPKGMPPRGPPSPPRGAKPSGAAPPSGAELSTAGELACDANAFKSMRPESSRAVVTLALGVGTLLLFVVAVSAESENRTLDSLRTPVVAFAG